MKRFILTIALLSSALVAGAQTSIEEVLRSVETNNKELQANRQMVTAQSWKQNWTTTCLILPLPILICMETKRGWDSPVN